MVLLTMQTFWQEASFVAAGRMTVMICFYFCATRNTKTSPLDFKDIKIIQNTSILNTQHLFCGKPMKELLPVNWHSSFTPSSLVSPPTTVVSPWGDLKHS